MSAARELGRPWDHPRVCGEKHSQKCEKGAELGSPPRVRGEGSTLAGGYGAIRITPACAGRSIKYAI